MDLADYHAWWKTEGGRGLRRVLMTAWDPIGVADVPEAQDEYDGYLGPVAGLLREGANEKRIAQFLFEIRTERMGMDPRAADDRRAARAILDWWAQQPPAVE
jgi:hypothetical protein